MVDATMANYDGLEETELRLGLPGAGVDQFQTVSPASAAAAAACGKRGFAETVDLKLNLAAKEMNLDKEKEKKKNLQISADSSKPPMKAQVVGWPPVRAFRRNAISSQKKGTESAEETEKVSPSPALVKVSMDGAPYLRKIDLKMYETYQQLSDALAKMFSSFTIGKCESQGMLDFMNESNLLNTSDYVPTYEDRDGDWMLVGDVPWEMFVETCKRLRIMKSVEAKGLEPRGKNRS